MIAQDLKDLRNRRGLSRSRLACIMTAKYGRGFSERSVEAWESDENPIPSIKAMALRKELD